ncbi:MAG: hypothetical protein KGY48_11365, partial [Wenzhouxiangellaceae bacterium]|nr:hypothetical protein [Wenzhouxiangellaceae bacterium]
ALPLVADDRMIYESSRQAPPDRPDFHAAAFLALGLASVFLIVGPALVFRSSLPALMGARGWIVVSGLGGGMLLFLWLFTAHEAAWRNENLLLLNPLALVLWRFGGGAVERAAAMIIAAGLVAAFVLKLFPGAQWNYDMMVWLVPAQISLLWAWNRESRRDT